MSGITLDASGILPLRERIRRAIVGVPKEVRRVNQEWVPRLREMLVQASSGPPGPGVETGAYNAAYIVETDGETVRASNPSPQSNRLEYGFVGEDAMGRMYHDPPRPHFRPTFDRAAPLYTEDIKQTFWKVW